MTCHELNKLARPVTVASLTTQGATTNQISRFYPQQLVPREDFAASQAAVWEQYGERLWSKSAYPSTTNMDFVEQDIGPR